MWIFILFLSFGFCACCFYGDPVCLSLRSIVSLQLAQPGTDFCEGVIIAEYYVLTTTHCILDKNAEDVFAVAGIESLNETGTRYQARTLIPHPDYTINWEEPAGIHNWTENNVGLIKTAKNIEFNWKVYLVHLPSIEVSDEEELRVLGWKETKFNMGTTYLKSLQELYMSAISRQACKEIFVHRKAIYDWIICATTEEYRAACLGESGSPVFNTKAQVVGLVSWDRYCLLTMPDIFISVYYYKNWIEANMV